MPSRYAAKALEALHDYFIADFATELRRVEVEASLGTNYLQDPSAFFYGVHPKTPQPNCMTFYLEEGNPIVPAEAGQRLQKWVTPCAIELRFRGAGVNPTNVVQQGVAGAFMQNDYYKQAHYITAMLGMFEPRGTDAGGSSYRPTAGGRVNVALVQQVYPEARTQLEKTATNIGITALVKVFTTNPVVG